MIKIYKIKMNLFFINSPLEQFEIFNLNDLVMNVGQIMTNSTLTICLITFLVLVAFDVSGAKLLPSKIDVVLIDGIYFTIKKMTTGQIGGSHEGKYFPLIYVYCVFILFANLFSLIPYTFAITAQFTFSISLSVILLLAATLIGIARHNVKFLGLFVPSGCSLALAPVLILIEMISYAARSVSLGLRLSANILSGHLLMVILAGLIRKFAIAMGYLGFLAIVPFVIVIAITALETAIGCIQAYVFCILACSYLKDAIYLH